MHGSTGSCRRTPARRGGTLNADDRTGLTGLDLAGRRLALAWRTAGPAGAGIPYGSAELLVDSLRGGRQTVVTRLVNSYLDYGGIVTPAVFGRRVRYGLIWVNEGGTTIGDLAEYDHRRARDHADLEPPATRPDGARTGTPRMSCSACASCT